MQEITRDILVERAVSLMENGTVDRVLGWKVGDFAYDVTPAVFRSSDLPRVLFLASQILQSLVFTEGNYLLGKIVHSSGKLCALCGRYPFNARAFSLDSEIIEHREEERHTAAGVIVT